MNKQFAIICAVVFVVTGGCGGVPKYDSVVTGTVTVDGELVDSGTVAFHPVKDGRAATGRIHSDGSYSLRTGQGDLADVDGGTVISGEYLVTVSVTAPPAVNSAAPEGAPPIPGPSLIHSKYAQRDTTDLRYTVKPGPQVIVLKLERAEPPADSSVTTENGDAEQATDAAETDAAQPATGESPSSAPVAEEQAAAPAAGSEASAPSEPQNPTETEAR